MSNLALNRLPGEVVNRMTRVYDVAAYILGHQGLMTTWKLQKLVYYCQAWSLVWDDYILFPKEIKAWAYGPVVCELYNAHRGKYRISSMRRGRPELLSKTQRETPDAVLVLWRKVATMAERPHTYGNTLAKSQA